MKFPSRVLATFAVPLALAACADSPRSAFPRGPLPDYTPRSAVLFDDGVDTLSGAYVFAPGGGSDLARNLRERAAEGDSVVRARVVTVGSRPGTAASSWVLELHPLENVAGKSMPSGDFTLEVPSTSLGSAALGQTGAHALGTQVLAFLRVFAGPDGTVTTHFHVTPAGESQIRVVRDAALLAEVR